ncbi:MAG: 3-dehydroquinate synthase family protein, partial [Dehalococcoidia bacterium]|nr:3-dehydroquinate synthase family protein [Dehalococcoidia bacterium]
LVIQDIELLSSLPKRELNSGWAEVIKHGLILDRELFYQLEHIGNSYKNELTSKRMISAIRYSVKIKSDVVSDDEYETGDTRILLNYGHTIGHALEKITKYKKFLHGEAVAIGMMVAARISYRIGMIELGVIQRQQAILQQFNLPVYFEKIDVNSLIEATRSDKKTREGSINWVLLTGIGTSAIQSDVPTSLVAEAIEETKHQRN